MVNPTGPHELSASSPRVRLPGIAVGLFVVAVILIVVGLLTLYGTSSRSFFENAPTQASLGAIMLLVGAGALLGGLVLVGVRAMLQQHVDLLIHNIDARR